MFKILSVYQIFCFQRTCICPSIGIRMQNTLKSYMFSSISCVDFAIQISFKVECWQKSHVVIFQWMFGTLKVFCMQKSAQNLDG